MRRHYFDYTTDAIPQIDYSRVDPDTAKNQISAGEYPKNV